MAQAFVFDGQSMIAPGQIILPNTPQPHPSSDNLILAKAELALTLDISLQQFQSGVEAHAIVQRLSEALHHLRRQFHANTWNEIVPLAQAHPVTRFLFQDPLTRWSFDKPRGYSGDAQLLDFIYGHPSVAADIAGSSELGKSVYDYTKAASSSVAVRERLELLARRVDAAAINRPGPTDVLAVAAGHLREAALSGALQEGTIGRWVALDQDPLSVGAVARTFEGTCIEAVDGSVKTLISGKQKLGTFDLIYAAGLYDYLNHAVAVKLTKACMRMLKPGGSLLFANFSDETTVAGYMETFMNWPLLLRTESDMRSIAQAAVEGQEAGVNVWHGGNRNIIYCELTKA